VSARPGSQKQPNTSLGSKSSSWEDHRNVGQTTSLPHLRTPNSQAEVQLVAHHMDAVKIN